MKRLLCTLSFLLFSAYAYADKYGIDESMDSEGLPQWLLGLIVIICIGYILHLESKSRGNQATASFREQKMQKEIAELKEQLSLSPLNKPAIYPLRATEKELQEHGELMEKIDKEVKQKK